jgi:hypothetical protein
VHTLVESALGLRVSANNFAEGFSTNRKFASDMKRGATENVSPSGSLQKLLEVTGYSSGHRGSGTRERV